MKQCDNSRRSWVPFYLCWIWCESNACAVLGRHGLPASSTWEEELYVPDVVLLLNVWPTPSLTQAVLSQIHLPSVSADPWKAVVISTPVLCICTPEGTLSCQSSGAHHIFFYAVWWIDRLWVCAYVCYLAVLVQRLESSLQELVLSYWVGSGDWTQVARLGCKCPYPLSHLLSPEIKISKPLSFRLIHIDSLFLSSSH